MEYWGVRKARVVGCLLRVRRMGIVAAQDFVLVLVVELVLQRVLGLESILRTGVTEVFVPKGLNEGS
jgi:hypothetical protein